MKRGNVTEIVRWILIILVLIAIGFLLWKYRGNLSGEKLVKIENCGELKEPSLRDECCSTKFKDQPHIQCVGNWKYTDKGCEFACV